MSPAPYRNNGFSVGSINNLRNDLNAEIYSNAISQAQNPTQQPDQQQGIDWLNAAGLGALAAGLGTLGYLGYKNRGRLMPKAPSAPDRPAATPAPDPNPPTPPNRGPAGGQAPSTPRTAAPNVDPIAAVLSSLEQDPEVQQYIKFRDQASELGGVRRVDMTTDPRTGRTVPNFVGATVPAEASRQAQAVRGRNVIQDRIDSINAQRQYQRDLRQQADTVRRDLLVTDALRPSTVQVVDLNSSADPAHAQTMRSGEQQAAQRQSRNQGPSSSPASDPSVHVPDPWGRPTTPISTTEGRPSVVQIVDLNSSADPAHAQTMRSGEQQAAQRQSRNQGPYQLPPGQADPRQALYDALAAQQAQLDAQRGNRVFRSPQERAEFLRAQQIARIQSGVRPPSGASPSRLRYVTDEVSSDLEAVPQSLIDRLLLGESETGSRFDPEQLANLQATKDRSSDLIDGPVQGLGIGDSLSIADISDALTADVTTEAVKDDYNAILRDWAPKSRRAIFMANPAGTESGGPAYLLRPNILSEAVAQGLVSPEVGRSLFEQASSGGSNRQQAKALAQLGFAESVPGLDQISKNSLPRQSSFTGDQLDALVEGTNQLLGRLKEDRSGDIARLLLAGGDIPAPLTKGASNYTGELPDPTRVITSTGDVSDPRASARFGKSSLQGVFTAPVNLDLYQGLRDRVTNLDYSSVGGGKPGEYSGIKQNIVAEAYRKSGGTWETVDHDAIGSTLNKSTGGMAGEVGDAYENSIMGSLVNFAPKEDSLLLVSQGSGRDSFDFADELQYARIPTRYGNTVSLNRATPEPDYTFLSTGQIGAIPYSDYINLPQKINNTGPALITSGSNDSIAGVRSFGRNSSPVQSDIRLNLGKFKDPSVTPFVDGRFSLNEEALPDGTNIELVRNRVDRTNELLRSHIVDPYKMIVNGVDLSNPNVNLGKDPELTAAFIQQLEDAGKLTTSAKGNVSIKLPMGLVASDPRPMMVNRRAEAALDDKKRANIFSTNFLSPNYKPNQFNPNLLFGPNKSQAANAYRTYVIEAQRNFGTEPGRSLFLRGPEGDTAVDRAILQGAETLTPNEQHYYKQYLENLGRDLASTFETSPGRLSLNVRRPDGKVVQTPMDPYRTIEEVLVSSSGSNAESTGNVVGRSLQSAILENILQQDNPAITRGKVGEDGEFFKVRRYGLPRSEEGYPQQVIAERAALGEYPEAVLGTQGFMAPEGMDARPDWIGFLRQFDDAYYNATGGAKGGRRVDSVSRALGVINQAIKGGDIDAAQYLGGPSSNPLIRKAIQEATTLSGISEPKYALNIQKPLRPEDRDNPDRGAGYDPFRGFDSATGNIQNVYDRTQRQIAKLLETNPEQSGPLNALSARVSRDEAKFKGPFGVGTREQELAADSPWRQQSINELLYPRSSRIVSLTKDLNPQQSGPRGTNNIYADSGSIPSATEAQAIYEQSVSRNGNLDNYEKRQELLNNSMAVKLGIGDNVIGSYSDPSSAFTRPVVKDLLEMNSKLAKLRGPTRAQNRGKLARMIDTATEAVMLPEGPVSLSPEQRQALSGGGRLLLVPGGGVMGVDQDGQLMKFGRNESKLVANLGLTTDQVRQRLAKQGVPVVPLSAMGQNVMTQDSVVAPQATEPQVIQGELNLGYTPSGPLYTPDGGFDLAKAYRNAAARSPELTEQSNQMARIQDRIARNQSVQRRADQEGIPVTTKDLRLAGAISQQTPGQMEMLRRQVMASPSGVLQETYQPMVNRSEGSPVQQFLREYTPDRPASQQEAQSRVNARIKANQNYADYLSTLSQQNPLLSSGDVTAPGLVTMASQSLGEIVPNARQRVSNNQARQMQKDVLNAISRLGASPLDYGPSEPVEAIDLDLYRQSMRGF